MGSPDNHWGKYIIYGSKLLTTVNKREGPDSSRSAAK